MGRTVNPVQFARRCLDAYETLGGHVDGRLILFRGKRSFHAVGDDARLFKRSLGSVGVDVPDSYVLDGAGGMEAYAVVSDETCSYGQIKRVLDHWANLHRLIVVTVL